MCPAELLPVPFPQLCLHARAQDVVFQYRKDQGMLQGVSLTVPAGEPPGMLCGCRVANYSQALRPQEAH